MEKSVSHRYTNVTFQPSEITQIIENGLKITIVPIDAKSLNYETFSASSRDGNYEKEFALEIESERMKNENARKNEKDESLELRIKSLERINLLIQRKEISNEVGWLMKRRIWYGKSEGLDGSEPESLSENSFIFNLFNPFYLNNRYLSVFKVTVENTSNEIKKIGNANFQILSNGELLKPFETNYLESNIDNNAEKRKNVHRYNMANEVVVTPKQKLTTYLATPAIGQNGKTITLQYINEDDYSDFDFSLNQEDSNKTYQLSSYQIQNETYPNTTTYFYVLKYKSGNSFAALANSIVDIYGIAVNESSHKISFGKKENIKFSNFEKNIVKMKFEDIRK